MVGVSLQVDVDVSDALAVLERKERALNNAAPLMQDIAQYLYNSTTARFREQRSPAGTPWAALNPHYRAEKAKNKDKILTLNGYLSGTLVVQHTDTTAVIGSNRAYAAIHQLGGMIKPKTGRALRFNGRFAGSVRIPARPYLGLSDDDKEEINALLRDYLEDA